MATTEDALPSEPDDLSAVRDKDGDVWQRRGSYWFVASALEDDGETWPQLLTLGPLHLLVDGPVIV